MADKKGDVKKLRLVTPEFRASHPHVFKPTSVKPGEDPSYSIEMLFDKKTTKLSDFQRVVKEAAVQKWGANQKDWPTPLKMPYRDGDKPYGKKKEVKEEHKGMWVIRASSKAEYYKPYVVGKDPEIKLTSESEFYPGCYARAAIKAHAYTFADKDGVKFVLDGVQFIRDGEALGGKPRAEDTFGIIEGDDGDDAFGMQSEDDTQEEAFF